MFSEEDVISLQNWVNQIADMQNVVTADSIMEWASRVPVKPIEEIDTCPIYLYGDATIDKAITKIIKGNVFTTNDAIKLTQAIKNNFALDVSVVDIPMNIAGSVSPIQTLDSWTEVKIKDEDKDKFKKYLEKNEYMNCEFRIEDDGTIFLKSKDAIPAHSKILKAMCNFSRKFNKTYNIKNFAKVTDNDLADKRLTDAGFELLDYSQIQWLLSNEIDSYIITKDTPGKVIEVETFDGNMEYFNSLDDFIDYVLKNKGKKNFSRIDGKPTDLNTMSLIMAMFANDLKYMHLNAVGDDFDKIHDIAENLYDKAAEDADTFAELAIRNHLAVFNFNDAQDIIPEEIYKPIHNAENYNMELFKSELSAKGFSVIGELRNIKGYTSEVQSKVDEILDFWSKEIEYKNEARKDDIVKTSSTEEFYKNLKDDLNSTHENFSNLSASERLRKVLRSKNQNK